MIGRIRDHLKDHAPEEKAAYQTERGTTEHIFCYKATSRESHDLQ